MTTSFFNGIAGLKSFQNGIDIWGNNIANINTPAFKENLPEFETIFSKNISSSPVSSDIGMGSNLNSSAINLQEGSLIKTNNTFDIALDKKGWLGVKIGKNIFYTRNGSFTKDKNGFLVNDKGAYLITANANNLIKTDKGYIVNTNINTDNLIKTGTFSPISLPDNVILPAIATTKVDIKTNLDNSDKITNLTPAKNDLYFSALYDKFGNALKMTENQSFAFTSGNIIYKNGLFQKEICINDNKQNGKNLVYDFNVNGKEIKATIPDGSTKEEIINTLASKLQQNNILYKKTPNSIIIQSPHNLVIKSNNNLVKNAEGIKFTYKDTPQNAYEFNTLSSLANQLQKALNNLYQNTSVTTQNGKIKITNNENSTINVNFSPTQNSNELFLKNISLLSHNINPNSSLESYTFNSNTKSFGGNIYEANGDKDTLSFVFSKKNILNDNTIWEANINIIKNNKIVSTQSVDFTFNKDGFLINPKSVKLNNLPITINTDLTAFTETHKSIPSFFSQNGASKGYLQKYAIDQNGNIYANFSNNKSVKLATIPVYHFINSQGLKNIGDSLFAQTSDSNKPFFYEDNGNYIPGAKFNSHTLETANVNFAQAMTELIINQKAFASAAKIVTTSDEMIKKAINLIQ